MDGGSSWEFLREAAAESVRVDPQSSQTVWMVSYPEGPMRSTDDGDTWETLAGGLGSDNYYAGNICISPTDSNEVLLCADRLYKWDSASLCWDLFGFNAYDAAFAPTDPSRIYVCDYYYVYYSDDAGQSWKVLASERQGYSIAVSYNDADDVLVASPYSGVWRSDDGFQTLDFSSNGIVGQYVTGILACDSEMQTLFSWSDDCIYRSSDGGNSWAPSVLSTSYYSYFCLGSDPSNRSVLYYTDAYWGTVNRSENAGETWAEISLVPGYTYEVNDIVVDPSNPSRVYMATTGYDGIGYRSTDAGVNWAPFPIYFGSSDYVDGWFVRVDPAASRRVFLGSAAGLFVSEDDCESFERMNSLSNYVPEFLEFDPTDPQIMYCGSTTPHGSQSAVLCVSKNGGETWAPMDVPVTSVCAIAINPDDGDEFYIAGAGSVHHTIDSGSVWAPLKMDGFDCPVTATLLVDFEETGNRIYATGAGAFSYLDIGAPFISLSLGQQAYSAGDTLTLTCDLTNPGAYASVDLIVTIELPDGTALYLPALGLNPTPFYSGGLPGRLSLTDYLLFETPVPSGVSGAFTVSAVFFEQGTDRQLSNIATETFVVLGLPSR